MNAAAALWPATAVTRRRAEASILFVVPLLLSTRLLASASHRQVRTTVDSPFLHQTATVAFSFFEFGAIRSGLAGTIVDLLGGNLLEATAIFHILSATFVSAFLSQLHASLGLGGPATPRFAEALARSDRGWREVLEAKPRR